MDASIAIPHLEEMVNATTRYLGALTDLTDEDMRAPSLLPGWSRGHVVTHLARNADALCNLLHWAETGVETPMYPSREQRDADIEAGAGRSAHDLRVDASASAGRFLQAINELDVRHEDALVSLMAGPEFPARDVALRRRIEVEVHHADLGLGFTHRDWDTEFAEVLLERVLEDRADGPAMVLRSTDTGNLWKYGVQGQGPEISGRSVDLAWYAVGRGDGSGLVTDADVLPELGAWR
ncbi:MAG TPA: maleylpyruvate isomerase family mycothiol-dependent enzyme [Nocardioidaceae bacterium]|nr:maleylpyruvate isomerase family mycothiol-dependent enzyme [Nocardioidaceae bacterium]